MLQLLRLRITAIWLLLLGVTCLSWGSVRSIGWDDDYRLATMAAIVVAFIKVRLVLLDFMELRSGPVALRLFFEAWVVVVCAAILVIYGGG